MATPSILSPAGPAAESIAQISWVLMAGTTVLFVGTMVVLALALRRRGGDVRPLRWLAGAGIALPIVILGSLFFYSVQKTPAWKVIPHKDALIVSVTARMWWWEVRYRDPRTGAEVVTANELRMPVGRPVVLGLSSVEVIHSLWIPELGGKMDMVPGRVSHLQLTASRPGIYRGQCAEFCGEAHARMALHAVAMPVADFDAWLTAQQRPAVETAAVPLQQAGRRVFEAQQCGACHTVRGVAEGGQLGPDLTHVGSRLHLAAGTLPNGVDGMARWLAHVQSIKPGTRMPEYGRLAGPELDALTHWLVALQ